MRRSLAALAVAAFLLTPGANQASLWDFISSLWSGANAEAGAGIDPFGTTAAPAPQPTPDAGAGWDPFG